MDNQTLFNNAWNHFVVGKAEPAFEFTDPPSSSGHCLYRTADGRRCAIGVSIPDGEYSEEFEGALAYELAEYVPALRGMDWSFITKLQDSHDVLAKDLLTGDRFSQAIEINFRQLARDFKLAIPGEVY